MLKVEDLRQKTKKTSKSQMSFRIMSVDFKNIVNFNANFTLNNLNIIIETPVDQSREN